MTDLHTLISKVREHADHENKIHFGGDDKIEVAVFSPDIVGHNIDYPIRPPHLRDLFTGVKADFCVFIWSFDDDHYAAYVYVLSETDVLRCTLVVSDGGDYHEKRELPPLNFSLAADEIAQKLITSLVEATKRNNRR